MKLKKSLLSVVLALVLFVLPCNIVANAALSSFGKCGENVTYSLSNDGVLTISGSGEMYDFTTDSPFYKSTEIKSIVVEDGVTSIGVWAFSKCSALESVEMADSVTKLGACAFYQCTSLTNIELSENIDGIYSHTFYGCSVLKSIDIPDSATIIEDSAFFKCVALESAIIGDGVKSIERYAFLDCHSMHTLSIGNGVEYIGFQAFVYCSGITNLTIGSGLKELGEGVFMGCKSIAALNLPSSLEIVGNYAFSQCSGIKNYSGGENIIKMGQNALGGTGWTNTQENGPLVFGKVIIGYKGSIPKNLDLSTVNAVSIAAGAFADKTSVASVVFPDGLKYIGESAFKGCAALATVEFKDGIESIGKSAFSGCTSLTVANFPNSLVSFGDEAFFGCSSLQTVTVGKGLSDFGISPFANCETLKTITVDAENPYYCDVDGVVFNKNMTALIQCPLGVENSRCTIPYTVTSIEDIQLGYKNRVLVPLDFAICGYRYTVAEEYAKVNKIPFKYLDSEIVTTKGDVTRDGTVNTLDAVSAARFTAGISELGLARQLAGDYDGDQKLSIADAVLIAKTAAGLTKTSDYAWLLKDTSKNYSSVTSEEPDESYVYKTVNSKKLVLNVYYPVNGLKAKNAAVICYEGSAWNPTNSTTSTWGGSYLKYTAQYFASKGYVGIEVNYRSLYTDLTTSVYDCIADCADGYKYVTENLSYIDPEMTVLLGESAGGHMALMMELCDLYTGDARPQAIVAMNPTIYLNQGYCLRTSLNQLAPSFEGLKEASPIYNVKKTNAKIIITQGEGDTITPLKYSQEFHDKMKAAGNDVKLIKLKGQEHSCLLFNYLNSDHYINSQMYKVNRQIRNALLF